MRHVYCWWWLEDHGGLTYDMLGGEVQADGLKMRLGSDNTAIVCNAIVPMAGKLSATFPWTFGGARGNADPSMC